MTDHTIFIEAHYDRLTGQVEMVVLCSCTALLLETGWDQDQLSLDEIIEAAWAHRDSQVWCEACNE